MTEIAEPTLTGSALATLEGLDRRTRWSRVARYGPWRRALIGGGLVWLVSRIAITTWGALVFATGTTRVPLTHSTTFFSLFARWDSNYYAAIDYSGYFGGKASIDVAFFPGYPLAARGLTTLLFGTTDPSYPQTWVGLWLVSLIASLGVAALLWKITADRFGGRVALAATTLMMLGPYSVFLVASYPESLFLVLALAAWYQASKQRWVAAASIAALASATCSDGVFLAAALAISFLVTAWRRVGIPPWQTFGRAVAIGFASASGMLAYFVYLGIATGNPMAWFTAERQGWHRIFRGPWTALDNQIAGLSRPGTGTAVHAQVAFELVFAVLCIAGAIVLARRGRWAAFTLVAVTLTSLMTNSNYESLARESLLLFPLPILVATSLLRPRWRWVFWVALVLGLVVLGYDSHAFVLDYWAD